MPIYSFVNQNSLQSIVCRWRVKQPLAHSSSDLDLKTNPEFSSLTSAAYTQSKIQSIISYEQHALTVVKSRGTLNLGVTTGIGCTYN